MSEKDNSNPESQQGKYVPRFWASLSPQIRGEPQHLELEPQQREARQEASPSPLTLEESFARFGQFERTWTEASNETRQIFGLPTMTLAEAAQARKEGMHGDAGVDENLLQYADTDWITSEQLRKRYQEPPTKRARGDASDVSDTGKLGTHTIKLQQERLTKRPRFEGEQGTEVAEFDHHKEPAGQDSAPSHRQKRAALEQPMHPGQQSGRDGSQQPTNLKPLNQPVARVQATSLPPEFQQQHQASQSQQQRQSRRDATDSGSMDEYGHVTFAQQVGPGQPPIARPTLIRHVPTKPGQPVPQVRGVTSRPRSQEQLQSRQNITNFELSSEPWPVTFSQDTAVPHSPITHPAKVDQMPRISSDQGQYQSATWGQLDHAAAVHAEPVAHRPLQHGYGAQFLPPPPANNVQRPPPRHKKTFGVSGGLTRPQSGLERTELYRALYPTVVALMQIKEQAGEQDAQIWIRTEDLRYDEAWNKVGEQFSSLIRDTSGPGSSSTAPFRIPKRGSIADGWVDYIEDWDMPYRGLRSEVERKRWLDYSWNSTRREAEKESVAPLDFDGSFLKSNSANQFWRADIEKWELGYRVLVRWDGKKLVIVDMESGKEAEHELLLIPGQQYAHAMDMIEGN